MDMQMEPEKIGDILYKVATTDQEVILARRLHHDSYLREGFIEDESPTGMIEDKYVNHSVYILALRLGAVLENKNSNLAEVVGVIRQIESSPVGFPTLNDFKIYPKVKRELEAIPTEEIVEISSLSTLPEYNVAKGLYRYAWQRSKILNHTHWLASIDAQLFKIFRRRLYFEFRKIGKEQFYMGSLTVPALLIREIQAREMPEKAPDLWDFFDSDIVPPKPPLAIEYA